MSLSVLVRNHNELVNAKVDWNALLPFVVSDPFLVSDKSPSLLKTEFKEQDLFRLVSSDGNLPSLFKWYFRPDQFPPDGDFKSSKDGWPKLNKALIEMCPVLVYSLVSNGKCGNNPKVFFAPATDK